MVKTNTKLKGNIAVGQAIAYYSSKKYIVSIPLTDSQSYDLLIDRSGILYKVQVKYSSQRKPSGNPEVTLKSVSGTTRKIYSHVTQASCDELFVYTSHGEIFIVPSLDVKNKNSLVLTAKYRVK